MPKKVDTESEKKSVRKKLPTQLVEVEKVPYVTSDICVSTYLTMQGYEVHSLGREEGDSRAVFCFMADSEEDKLIIRQHVKDYHNNKGNYRLFADCWRNLKGMVHNLK